jgi:hypothetical protein
MDMASVVSRLDKNIVWLDVSMHDGLILPTKYINAYRH